MRLFSLSVSPLSLCRAALENEVHFTLCCSALKDLRQRLIPDKFYSQPSSFRLVMLLSTENKVIIKNFAIFLYLAFKRRELLLREWWRDCIVTFVPFTFVYIHLHTVKILDIRVIAISYDLHVPLNTLLKYSLQLLVKPLWRPLANQINFCIFEKKPKKTVPWGDQIQTGNKVLLSQKILIIWQPNEGCRWKHLQFPRFQANMRIRPGSPLNPPAIRKLQHAGTAVQLRPSRSHLSPGWETLAKRWQWPTRPAGQWGGSHFQKPLRTSCASRVRCSARLRCRSSIPWGQRQCWWLSLHQRCLAERETHTARMVRPRQTCLMQSCLETGTGGDRDPRRWGKRETIPIATLAPPEWLLN